MESEAGATGTRGLAQKASTPVEAQEKGDEGELVIAAGTCSSHQREDSTSRSAHDMSDSTQGKFSSCNSIPYVWKDMLYNDVHVYVLLSWSKSSFNHMFIQVLLLFFQEDRVFISLGCLVFYMFWPE